MNCCTASDMNYSNWELELALLKKETDLFKTAVPGTNFLQEFYQFASEQRFKSCVQICSKEIPFSSSIDALSTSVEEWLLSDDDNRTERSLILFCCAVSSLQLFVQVNWTGPHLQSQNFPKIFALEASSVENTCKDLLAKDGNSVYHLVHAPLYLFVAESIFHTLERCNSSLQTLHWWSFRCYNVHSQLLTERSDSLFAETIAELNSALKSPFLHHAKYRSLLLQLHLEAGLSLLHYYQYKQASNHFDKAKEVAGIDFSFTGALGVRTKFQQKPVSQLQLRVTLDDVNQITSFVDISSEEMPENLPLNDDTLLEKPKVLDSDSLKNPDLLPEHLAVLLAACTAMHKASPASKLQDEEISAIVQVILSSPSCWCVCAEALRVRCKSERSRWRTVERSMTQLENLVAMVTEPASSEKCRLNLFYCVRPPPIWMLQKDLCDLYMSLGAVSSAYQLYERLEMWEEAIVCLIQSDRAGAAMDMIKKQLAANETPNLWCLLGDLTQEPQHYVKAWELSHHRSARAMRSLGGYYTSKKKYTEAVECYQTSLSVLSLQVGTWFTMGCTLLVMEEFDKAAHAFRRCVGLDWDNFQAWTNLSTAYVRCNKKIEAFKALSEAIKCNFDKWELWENYAAISADVGHFSEALSAYNRLLDLKGKFIDTPILRVLVRAVTENIVDANGNPGSFLRPKLRSLLGRITSNMSTDSTVWVLYGDLYGNGVLGSTDDKMKAVEILHKALRTGMQKANWDKDEELTDNNVRVACKLSTACSHCGKDLPAQTLASLRLSVKGLVSKLKQREKAIFNEEAQLKIAERIRTVDEALESIAKIVNIHAPS